MFQERYEILSKLGEGGFSQVYRARQRATGQEVAVKVLHWTHAQDEALTARFQREMRLCARLYHPHIVRLIDSGRSDEGLLYTVFEYVPGRTLGDVLASEGALPPWEASHLMLQVLDALGCAHKLGIVHRDLKPQNIMLTNTGVRRNALVLDFGLGTLSDEDRREDLSRITRTRDTLGTPAYAAPEQLRGEPVTARTDLYAWGLIFLECLTGKRVVEGSSLQELLFKQLGSEPVPMPVWLEGHRLGRLLRRATEKNPQARDVTAQNLLLELEASVTQGWPAGEAGVPARPDSLQQPADGERRQLTAVCCGLRLAGEGVDTADVEDLDALLWTHHAACIELARRREAWLGSVLGERLLLYFGYPQAQEDDAQRAAHMALELMEELVRRGAELERTQGIQLEARVGIHTGLVISRELRREGMAGLPVLTGTTPGIAERLESLAQPGEILVSEVTAKVVKDTFGLEPSGAHRVGVGTRPVPVFRLRDRHRVPASGLEGTPAGPMFGRALELELLMQRWRQVLAGMGQGILITGESGIGKTRLTQELALQTRHWPHAFLECRCAPEWRNSTLRPMVDLLERMLGVGRDCTPAQLRTALEKLLSRYGFELAEYLPLFSSLLSLKGTSEFYPRQTLSPQRQKEETISALLALFFEMSQQEPVLMVVEDLHWADPLTLELLAQLLKDATSTRLCLVLTSRPNSLPSWPSNLAHQVQLNRLERPQVEEMVRGLSRESPLPPELVEQVVNRTDGVPLFIEELTRMLVEALARQGTAPTPEMGALAIPSTLRDSLMARLDRLGPVKATAQLAAALGREFQYEMLEAAFGEDTEALRKDLDALVVADLVHRRRGTRNPVYAFKHALIRDTAYESMVKPLRRQVHTRIATALEQRFPELVQQRPDLLARHYAAAEKRREALGYAHKAALAALMRSSDHEALGHATEALGWLESVQDVRERARWELDLNGVIIPAVMATRGWSDPSVKTRVERSQSLIDLLGDSAHSVPTLWALVNFHHLRAHHAQAHLLVERLLNMEGLAQDVNHQQVVLPLLGDCLCAEGEFVRARECALRALSFAADNQPRQSLYLYGVEPRIYARLVLALAKWHLGLPEKAMRMLEAALALAHELRHASTLALAYIFALGLYQLQEDLERHTALAQQAHELMERQRFVSQGAYCEVMRYWGKRDLEGMDRAIAALDEQGSALFRPFYSALAAEVEASMGRHEAAKVRLEEALLQARAWGEGFSVMHVLIRLGCLLLETGLDTEAGEAHLREALALTRERKAKMLELRAAMPLSRFLLQKGQRWEARELLVPLYAWFTEGADAPDLVKARALIEELGGT